METTIKIFSNPIFGDVRTLKNENDEILICLSDVCKTLDLQVSAVVRRLSDEVISSHPMKDGLGRVQSTYFVNEDGFYDVILDSKKQEAKAFRKWVTSEVLPSIRKTGGYIKAEETDTPELIMAKAIMLATDTIERQKKQIEEKDLLLQVKDNTIKLNSPKVQYYDEVLASKNGHTITTIAYNYAMSAVTLNRLLVLGKVMRKTAKEYSLTAKYQGKNYTVNEKFTYVNSKGELASKNEIRWTEAGYQFIRTTINRAKEIGALKEIKGRFFIDKEWEKSLKNKTNNVKN